MLIDLANQIEFEIMLIDLHSMAASLRAWLQMMHLTASGHPMPPILLPLRPAVVPIQPAGVDFSQVMLETPAECEGASAGGGGTNLQFCSTSD